MNILNSFKKIPVDKVLHFSISFILFTLYFTLSRSLVIATILTTILGIAKEIYDMKITTNNFDSNDMLANLLGILLALLIHSLYFIL